MPFIVKVRYWEGSKQNDNYGHISVEICDAADKSLAYRAYYPNDSNDYANKMRVIEDYANDAGRMGGEESLTEQLVHLDGQLMLEWLKKFDGDESDQQKKSICYKKPTYRVCHPHLVWIRCCLLNCSDSPFEEHVIKSIQEYGHANCSVFAYALLRVGGLQLLDGVPKRHILLTMLYLILNVFQILAGMNKRLADGGDLQVVNIEPNATDAQLLVETTPYILAASCMMTLLSGIGMAIYQWSKGYCDIIAPALLWKLVKRHQKQPTNHLRVCCGPNNPISALLYTLLTLSLIAKTVIFSSSHEFTTAAYLDIGSYLFYAGAVSCDVVLQSTCKSIKPQIRFTGSNDRAKIVPKQYELTAPMLKA